jgi:hypothetical protein
LNLSNGDLLFSVFNEDISVTELILYKQDGNVMINCDNVKGGTHGLLMILAWRDFRELGIQFSSLDINWVTALTTNEILTQTDHLLSLYVYIYELKHLSSQTQLHV